MASLFRDRGLGESKRDMGSSRTPVSDLVSPFGELGCNLSYTELRETAYEIFVGACRSSGGKPLTFISQSERGIAEKMEKALSVSPSSASPSLQRSLTSTAASKMKKALGLKSLKNKESSPSKSKRPVTVGELMRVQMKVSEQMDSRIRRALLRISAGQVS